MTSSTPSLSSIPAIALFSAASLGAAFALIAFPVALIGLSTTAFLLMILARDYAPRTHRWDRLVNDADLASTSPQRFRLAA